LAHSGSYLQDRDESELLSPMDYSMELTRPFRSLRLWLTLKLHGADRIKKALQEKLALADYCRQRLQNLAGLEMIGPMDLSIMAFRLIPTGAADQADRATQSLLQRILAKGEVFLSSTTIDSQFVIRVAIMSFRTHLDTVDRLLSIIETEIKAVQADFAKEGESI
jgi:glutamate/tyrosine decarboxylase-like PLP-dependent enzyme